MIYTRILSLLLLLAITISFPSCSDNNVGEEMEEEEMEEEEEEESITIWTGASITFTKVDGGDPTVESNQDRITDNVWITRGNNGGQIYNIAVESGSSINTSPTGTKWAFGKTENIDNLDFMNFRDAIGKPKDAVGQDLVLFLVQDRIAIDLKITSWSEMKSGGFSYERSTL